MAQSGVDRKTDGPNCKHVEHERIHVAVGPIEPQFWAALVQTLGLDEASTPSPYVADDWDACKKVLTEAEKK